MEEEEQLLPGLIEAGHVRKTLDFIKMSLSQLGWRILTDEISLQRERERRVCLRLLLQRRQEEEEVVVEDGGSQRFVCGVTAQKSDSICFHPNDAGRRLLCPLFIKRCRERERESRVGSAAATFYASIHRREETAVAGAGGGG